MHLNHEVTRAHQKHCNIQSEGFSLSDPHLGWSLDQTSFSKESWIKWEQNYTARKQHTQSEW